MTPRRNSTKDRRACFDAHKADFRCHLCNGLIDPVRDRWEAEHVVPLSFGGTDLRPAHVECHAVKTAKDLGHIAKAKRVADKHNGVRKARRPMAGSRDSGWKIKMNGSVEKRR